MREGVSVARPSITGGLPTHEASLPVDGRGPDAESLGWVEALSGTGRTKDDAIERGGRTFGYSRPIELDDLATQAAADALMAIREGEKR
jgi:hypothetical protein